MDESVPKGPADAFHIEREFAHIHPRPDGSLHLQLPMDLAALAMGAGDLLGDKMKTAPDRTVVLGLLARVMSAGIAGAAIRGRGTPRR